MPGRGAASVVLLCVLAAAPATAAPRGRVLVLTPGTAPSRAAAFLLALSVQLDPYGIATHHESLALPASLAAQAALARERGARASATAVVWFSADEPLTVHLLDLRRGHRVVQSLEMGKPTLGIERSMAVAVRTLLRASPLQIEAAPLPSGARPAGRRPGTGRVPPLQVRVRPLLQFGAGYAVDGVPLGRDVRHGPELGLSVRLWRRGEGRLVVGYRTPHGRREPEGEWSQSAWSMSWSTAASWTLRRRWELLVGPRVGFAAVHAEARALDGTRLDQARQWEVSLGGEGAGRVRIGRRLSAELIAAVAWLPLGRSLSLRGRDVVRSGGLALSAAIAVQAGFF
jgi:hypothetical protein